MSTLALKGALEAAAPGLRASFHATQALLKSIAAGESADVVILTAEGIDRLVKEGRLIGATRVDLGSSGVGLAVRAGARKPDISSLVALKETLLNARSVAHSKVGASGLYFADLLQRLGLAEKLKKRIVVEQGPVAARVASGEAEIGAQLLCELAPVKGIDIVGPLPDEVQKHYSFSAAAMKDTPAARAFLGFLRSPQAAEAMQASLLVPGPRSPGPPG